MLERIEVGAFDTARPPILLLHDAESRPDGLLGLAESLDGRRVVIPRAPRWASHRSFGQYSWCTAPEAANVDPVGFGDSLAQLELLLLSLTDLREGARLAAVGFGQGGTIAATLAALWPERFSWLVLVDSVWPDLPDDLLPPRSMGGLPVLETGGGDAARMLARRGASIAAAPPFSTDISSTIRQWMSSIEASTGARQ